jgi:hypothetical protein
MNLKSTSVLAGLLATSALTLSTPAQAFTLNPNGSVTFTNSETLQFEFKESRGLYRSNYGIFDSNKNLVTTLFSEKAPGYDPGSNDANGDWLGTPGVTVDPFIANYTFAAGTYFFGLSTPGTPTLFTEATGNFDSGVASLNGFPSGGTSPGNPPNAAFISTADVYYRSTVGPAAIAGGANPNFQPINTSQYAFFTAINDSDDVDKDVQDFIVGVKSVPEPATLGGLALVGGAMGMLRRRKAAQVS